MLNKKIISFLILSVTIFGSTIPVYAQFSGDNSILKSIPKFQFSGDSLLEKISPKVDFGLRIKLITETVQEIITFDPAKKAELKIRHAQDRQNEINTLESKRLPIPVELEEDRIRRLNDARKIINNDDRINPILSKTFEELRQVGELNDIRVLYSQLDKVVNSNDKVKTEYNKKVNALRTWQENCIGSFDVNEFIPLNSAVDILEQKCPKLIDLQNNIGYDRLKSLVIDKS